MEKYRNLYDVHVRATCTFNWAHSRLHTRQWNGLRFRWFIDDRKTKFILNSIEWLEHVKRPIARALLICIPFVGRFFFVFNSVVHSRFDWLLLLTDAQCQIRWVKAQSTTIWPSATSSHFCFPLTFQIGRRYASCAATMWTIWCLG